MKQALKKWAQTNLYLLLLATVFFILAFVWNRFLGSNSTASYYTNEIEKNIQKKEKHFQSLNKDTALIAALVNSNYSQDTLTDLLEDKLGYGFFIYDESYTGEPVLRFWNTQSALPPLNLMQESDVSRMVTLKNGQYVHVSKQLNLKGKRYAIEAIIPVLHKYFVEVENLQTEFEDFPDALRYVQYSTQPTVHKVNSSFGNTLFYLQPINENQHKADPLLIVLVLLGFFFLSWFVHQLAHKIAVKLGWWKGALVLVAAIIMIRLVIYFIPSLLDLRQFELFDPAIYSSSYLLGSLGDLLINVVLFYWVAFFINRRIPRFFSENKQPSWLNWLLVAALTIVLVVSTLLFARVIQSIVADAKISFNVTNVFSLNIYSAVAFGTLATLGLAYFLMSQVLLRYIQYFSNGVSYINYIVIGAVGLLILTFSGNSDLMELNLMTLLWLVVFVWLMQREYFAGLSSSFQVADVLFWLFVFSMSISTIIFGENRKIEFEQRKRFAEKLSLQADPSNERLLSIAFTYLDNDFLAHNYLRFRDKSTNLFLKDSILNVNFSPYLNLFDARMYMFEAGANPQSMYNEDPISYDTLNTIYNVQGKPTSIADLRYFEQSFDQYSYIFKREIRSTEDSATLGYCFIIADPRKYKRDALVPELFRQAREYMMPENTGIYSYAIYSDYKLLDYYNEYGFPSTLEGVRLPRTEFETRKNGDYEELWYRKSSDKIVVIAKKGNAFIESITLFAYLFSTFLVLIALYWMAAVVIRSRFRWSVFKKHFQFSIKSQIHSTILLVSLLSFIVIGAATIVFFINRYNRNNQERLSRTMQIMIKSVENKLKQYNTFNDGLALYEAGVNEELAKLMEETSEIHGTDINLYDPQGTLRVTSRPLIYNKGVLSDKMNPDAYYSLHVMSAIQTVKQERMGKVDFLSIYNPVRTADGTIFAYLNVPSYSSQGELKQEISNFLVTLINLNAFIFLIAGAIALFITNRITYSFTLIGQKMRDINLSKENQEIDWTRNDEIGELVIEYNKMVQKLEESAAALAKSEREGAWRQMARQVAHEIKNPLTPMKLSIQYLQKAIDNNSPNVKEMTTNVAKTLVEQIDHLSKIASDFSQFANIGNPKNEVFDLHEIFQSLSALYSATETTEFKWQPISQRVIVFADKTQLNRLFTNLLQNAVEAASSRDLKKITIRESIKDAHIIIEVEDNGEGIPAHTRDRIFTPNFTTKTSGTGLGLAMSKGIVENAQGSIWFETHEGEGTVFFVKLPIVRTKE
ncbi:MULTISPECIES: sensor histidine kinase [unclassified Paraflavitalea]|uniref:sensor histidine kinase n=1 Tax=unclassified Paraflavitalea TaxID=2798305 RepID=UPI003D354C10